MRLSPAWQLALIAAGAAIIGIQLFAPPILGVADNADFIKLSGHACIGPENKARHPLWDHYVSRYAIRSEYCGSNMATSAVIPLYLSLGPARWLLPEGQYDLRVLGALYGVLFLGAFLAFLRLPLRSAALAMFAMLVFFSASYVPMFSTFYMDTAAFVFLLWAVLLGTRVMTSSRVGLGGFAALTVAVLLLATTKVQHAPAAICFVPVFWFSFRRKAFPKIWARWAATVAVVGGTVWFLETSSPWYRAIALYDGLFFKFLPACDHPAAELSKLGLDASFEQYVGQHAYSNGTHMQEQDYALSFGQRVGVPKIAMFLLAHPKVMASALRHDLEEGSLERVRMKIGSREYRLGSYLPDSGHAPEAQSHFLSLWPALKQAIYARRPWVYLTYCLAMVALLWMAAWHQPSERAPALVGVSILTALLPASFGPPFLDAVDTGRHLFLFNAVLDICACTLAWLAMRCIIENSRLRSDSRPPSL